jgi:hypothetical protein
VHRHGHGGAHERIGFFQCRKLCSK